MRGGGGDIYASDDVIAWHCSLGELPAQSVAFWHRAAKEAISRSAHEEALAMLDFALEDYKKLAVPTPTMELDLILAKATALRSMSGYSAPAVAQALTRARDLCEASEYSNNKFNVEWGLFQANLVRGNLCGARALADQLVKDSNQHPGLPKVDALLADGMAAFHFGDFERARHSFQAGVALARPESDEPHFFTHGQNPGVFCLSYLAHAQCFLGQLDKARETIECSVAISRTRARNPAHIYGYVNALTFAVRVHEFCGDVGSEKQRAKQIIDISRRNGFAYYAAVSTCHLAWTTGIGVSLTDGISKMTDGIVALERTGTSLSVPRFFVLLAELYIRAGQLGKAEQAIEKASASEQTRTHAWDAEIERVRGDIIAMKPGRDVAAAMSAYERVWRFPDARRHGCLSSKQRSVLQGSSRKSVGRSMRVSCWAIAWSKCRKDLTLCQCGEPRPLCGPYRHLFASTFPFSEARPPNDLNSSCQTAHQTPQSLRVVVQSPP